MNEVTNRLHALLTALGVGVWLLPWLALGRKEAWDHPSYFLISLPLMTVAAAYAGYTAKTRAWRWPLTLIAAQFAAALVVGGFGNLMPLGIIAFVILAAPMFVAAPIGAWLGRRKQRLPS